MLQEPEAPPTELTLERPLSRVDARVLREVAPVVELLPALFAVVRLLSGVDQLVLLQVHGLAEALAAL